MLCTHSNSNTSPNRKFVLLTYLGLRVRTKSSVFGLRRVHEKFLGLGMTKYNFRDFDSTILLSGM